MGFFTHINVQWGLLKVEWDEMIFVVLNCPTYDRVYSIPAYLPRKYQPHPPVIVTPQNCSTDFQSAP